MELAESYRFGRDALKYITDLGVDAIPRNYEVIYSYLQHAHGELAREIRDILQKHKKLSSTDLEKIHSKHLSPTRYAELAEGSGGQLSDVLSATVSLLGQSVQTASGYSESLDSAEKKFGGALDKGELVKLASQLKSATETMRNANEAAQEELRSSQEKIRQLSENLAAARAETLTDALTELGNRKKFDLELAARIKSAESGQHSFCLIVLDVDHFKNFNDTHGHQTGDQVLRLVGMMIRHHMGKGMVPCRYGGEEFATFLPDVDLEAARKLSEKIRVTLAKKELVKRSTNKTLGRVTISSGISIYRAGDTGSSILERADQALYAAKDRGRNQVVLETGMTDSGDAAVA